MMIDFDQIVTQGKNVWERSGSSPYMFNKIFTARIVPTSAPRPLTERDARAIKPRMKTVSAIIGICIIG